MPSHPKSNSWPYLLADEAGVWCYECLGYIDPDGKDGLEHTRHHIVQRSLVKRLCRAFRGTTGQQTSTVWPTVWWWVSAHESCHDQAEEIANLAGERLERVLGLNTKAIEVARKRRHDEHRCGEALLLNLELLQRTRDLGDIDRLWDHLKFVYASGTAVSWFPAFERVIQGLMPSIDTWDRWDVLLNAAKEHAIRGHHKNANRYLQMAAAHISGLRGPQKHNALVLIGRARASMLSQRPRLNQDELRLLINDADRAVSDAESLYMQWTGKILCVGSLFKRGDIRESLDCAKEVLSYDEGVPWAYRAMCLFVGALIALYNGDSWKSIYKDLVCAQYISCALGLRGQAQRLTDYFLDEQKRLVNPLPGHILCNMRRLGIGPTKISCDELTDLRKQAIGSRDSQESIWWQLRCTQPDS